MRGTWQPEVPSKQQMHRGRGAEKAKVLCSSETFAGALEVVVQILIYVVAAGAASSRIIEFDPCSRIGLHPSVDIASRFRLCVSV